MQVERQILSEIVEESYKDEVESTKLGLIRLANQQFLLNYISFTLANDNLQPKNTSCLQLEPHINVKWQPSKSSTNVQLQPSKQATKKSGNEVPSIVPFTKFNFEQEQAKDRLYSQTIIQEIKKSLEGKVQALSIEQLRAMALDNITKKEAHDRKLIQTTAQRDLFYSKIKAQMVHSQIIEQQQLHEIKQESQANQPKLSCLFNQMEKLDDIRLEIRTALFQVDKQSREKQNELFEEWIENHNKMKQVLQLLLQKVSQEVGIVQIYKQINKSNQKTTSSIESSQKGFNSPIKSMASTSRGSPTVWNDSAEKNQKHQLLDKFDSWFNCLFLNQQEIEVKRHAILASPKPLF